MRPVVLIAGLALSAMSATAVAQPAAGQPTRSKPATLVGAVSALLGRSACPAPATPGVPGAGPAVGQPARDHDVAQAAPDHATPPRLAGTMCREALPSYDAGGQATYLPSRACGRY